jgi:hypothetical protein
MKTIVSSKSLVISMEIINYFVWSVFKRSIILYIANGHIVGGRVVNHNLDQALGFRKSPDDDESGVVVLPLDRTTVLNNLPAVSGEKVAFYFNQHIR